MVSDCNNDLKRWDQESVQKLMPEIANVIRGAIGEQDKYALIIDPALPQALYFKRVWWTLPTRSLKN